eukprot:1818840-Rhodomonas_salina.2
MLYVTPLHRQPPRNGKSSAAQYACTHSKSITAKPLDITKEACSSNQHHQSHFANSHNLGNCFRNRQITIFYSWLAWRGAAALDCAVGIPDAVAIAGQSTQSEQVCGSSWSESDSKVSLLTRDFEPDVKVATGSGPGCEFYSMCDTDKD